jgi:hypothetical protein
MVFNNKFIIFNTYTYYFRAPGPREIVRTRTISYAQPVNNFANLIVAILLGLWFNSPNEVNTEPISEPPNCQPHP